MPRSEGVREGGVEPPCPFGHRILRLVRLGTELASASHLVSSGVIPCRSVPFRREQVVSKELAMGAACGSSSYPETTR